MGRFAVTYTICHLSYILQSALAPGRWSGTINALAYHKIHRRAAWPNPFCGSCAD